MVQSKNSAKRFFRKKVKKIVPSELQAKVSGNFLGLNHQEQADPVPTYQEPSNRVHFVRRSDDGNRQSIVQHQPQLAQFPSFPASTTKDAWWLKYLTEPVTDSASAATQQAPVPALNHFTPDYMQNPMALFEGGSASGFPSAPPPTSFSGKSSPSGGSVGNLLGIAINRIYTQSAPSYLDWAMMTSAAQAKQEAQQQEAAKGMASKLRNLYGKNRIALRQKPTKKFLTKLASPYTYYAYQNVQDNYGQVPSSSSSLQQAQQPVVYAPNRFQLNQQQQIAQQLINPTSTSDPFARNHSATSAMGKLSTIVFTCFFC